MLEDQEEILEQWFFKHYANRLDLDLEVYFCIEKLRSMLVISYCTGNLFASVTECPCLSVIY